ncbi:hypothetical protein BBP40_007068 [Aspergillus hancockii]|nr:hypothetical protein BBP40_007068 [Aspergillus hancockii]
MAGVGFGFSVRDFIAERSSFKVIEAFKKKVGGASSQYTSQVSFLQGLKATLGHLEQHVRDNPQNGLSTNISTLLDNIREPWHAFQKILEKYDRALGQIVVGMRTKDKLRRMPKATRFTLDEISGQVGKLRREVCQPLEAINSLLLLQVMYKVALLSEVGSLTCVADEHNAKQDEQLETIKTLRRQLNDRTLGWQDVIDDIRQGKTTKSRNNVRQEASHLTSLLKIQHEKLDTVMSEQRRLIRALKMLAEDKASSKKENLPEKQFAASWPSATLATAYFAALMLPSVVSTCAATSSLRISGIPSGETNTDKDQL